MPCGPLRDGRLYDVVRGEGARRRLPAPGHRGARQRRVARVPSVAVRPRGGRCVARRPIAGALDPRGKAADRRAGVGDARPELGLDRAAEEVRDGPGQEVAFLFSRLRGSPPSPPTRARLGPPRRGDAASRALPRRPPVPGDVEKRPLFDHWRSHRREGSRIGSCTTEWAHRDIQGFFGHLRIPCERRSSECSKSAGRVRASLPKSSVHRLATSATTFGCSPTSS